MDIWKMIRKFGVDHLNSTGLDTFETSLLGYVGSIMDKGEMVGYIPPALQNEANKHGLAIEAAFYREGKYSLRVLPNEQS